MASFKAARMAALMVPALVLASMFVGGSHAQSNATTVEEFLQYFEDTALVMINRVVEAAWNYDSNITAENEAIYIDLSLEYSEFIRLVGAEANFYLTDETFDKDEDETRQLTMLAQGMGTAAQTNETKVERLAKIVTEMSSIYAMAEVCPEGETECYLLDPYLTEIMRSSRDCQLLSDVWRSWRDESGKKMKDLYTEYVDLSNEAVQIIGYSDYGEYWRSFYDDPAFEEDIARLLEEIRPLYENLHAYVRRKLIQTYGEQVFPSTGHIPAHLLGNMWAQTWGNIYELVIPYKGKNDTDVSDEMVKQGYTVTQMFEMAEDFFASMTFGNMTDTFWEKSILVRQEGVEMVCHGSAWDFYKKDDFRIKMCTVVNEEDLITIHHEMGHIQYFMEYENQPVLYRDGANPGFHEAVGDTIALSTSTPEHLNIIGLLDNVDEDEEADINFLMQMALEKVAFLPFGYLIDQWRWSVFRGDTPPDKYNEDWWKLRCELQGIAPPVERSNDDFDPGCKYHVAADVPYIRYFVSFILQFQFYKAACEEAYGPVTSTGYKLHRCDFYNSVEAGEKFRAMLQLGSSKPWPEALEQMTGQREMDSSAILEYFRPLQEFLEKENEVAGEKLGWDIQCPEVPVGCGSTTPVSSASTLAPVWLQASLVAGLLGLLRLVRMH